MILLKFESNWQKNQHWFFISRLGTKQTTSHYLNKCWWCSMLYGVTMSQWVNFADSEFWKDKSKVNCKKKKVNCMLSLFKKISACKVLNTITSFSFLVFRNVRNAPWRSPETERNDWCEIVCMIPQDASVQNEGWSHCPKLTLPLIEIGHCFSSILYWILNKIYFSWGIPLEFCVEHDTMTAIFCTNFRND